MAFLLFVETAALAALVAFAWRRSRPATAPFRRELAFIALLVLAQAAAQAGHFLVTDRNVRLVGFSWAVQGFRAACLILVLAQWFRLVRWHGADRRAITIAVIAALAVAFGNGALAFVGACAFFALMANARWPAEVHGFDRAMVLLVAP